MQNKLTGLFTVTSNHFKKRAEYLKKESKPETMNGTGRVQIALHIKCHKQ